ncbi:hypothetical protein Esti_000879 [Eimeria stiedai]
MGATGRPHSLRAAAAAIAGAIAGAAVAVAAHGPIKQVRSRDALQESYSPPPDQADLFVSPVVSAYTEPDEITDHLLGPSFEGGPILGGGPPIAWGPLYTLAGLTAAAAGGALLGALREKKPQHVAKALAVAAFLLPAAAVILLLCTAPLPGVPPSPSLQGPPERAPLSTSSSFLVDYLLGALRDWQRSLSFAAACLLLLREAQGLLLLFKAPLKKGPLLLNSKGPHPQQLSLPRTTVAGTREGGAPLLSLLQAEAPPIWRGPQARRAWSLSIALQMCLLIFLPWLGAALWLLRPAAAAAAVWVSGPCLPSGSAVAAAAAAGASAESSRLQYLLREAAAAAAAAKALNPSVLLCLSLLLSLPLKLLPSFAAAAAALAACCRWGAASRFLALISSSSSSSGSRSSKGAPYGAADVLLLLLLAADAFGLHRWLFKKQAQQQQQRCAAFDWRQDSEGKPAASRKARVRSWVVLRDATVVAEVSKGEVQVHNKTAAAAVTAAAAGAGVRPTPPFHRGGTTGPLFRDKDGDEAYEFFHVDARGCPIKVPPALLQRVGRRPQPKLL